MERIGEAFDTIDQIKVSTKRHEKHIEGNYEVMRKLSLDKRERDEEDFKNLLLNTGKVDSDLERKNI